MTQDNPVTSLQRRTRFFKSVMTLVVLCMAMIYTGILYRDGAINMVPGSFILKTGYYTWSLDWNLEDLLNATGFFIFLMIGICPARARVPGPGMVFSGILIFLAASLCWIQVTGAGLNHPADLALLLTLTLIVVFVIFRLMPCVSVRLSRSSANRIRDVTGFILGCAMAIFSWQMIYGGNEIVNDAQSQVVQARMLASGQWVLPMSQAMCDVIEFPNPVFTPPVFSQYPPGYILALVPLVLLDWPIQLLNVLISGLIVLFTGRMTLRLGGMRASWIAVFLMLTSCFFMGMAGTGMNHSLNAILLLGVAAILIPLSRPLDSGDILRRGLLAGLLLGWAVSTRPLTGVAHSVVWALIWMIMLVRAGSAGRTSRPVMWRYGLWVMIGLIPAALVFMFYNFKTTGHPLTLAYQLSNPDLHQVGFWDSNELDFGPVDAMHHMSANLFALNWMLFGWPIGSMVVLVIWWFRTRLSRAESCMLALILVQSGLYATYQFHDLLLGPRFLYDLFPMLIIFSATALAGITRGRAGAYRVLWVVLILFAGAGVIRSYTHWYARFIMPAERCRHFKCFMDGIEPLDRPTVIVMPRPYHEVNGLHFFHRRFEHNVWYVLKENEAKARLLPKFRDHQWIEFVP
jgi:hypothetical protein